MVIKLKSFTRRELFKILTGCIASIISVGKSAHFYGGRKRFKEESMSGIMNIVELPEQGPWPTRDPFLFCVYHQDTYPEANDDLSPNASLSGRNLGQDFSNKDGCSMYHGEKVPGFPKHPHRGFETLTVVNEGIIDHSDSLGSKARYGDGDAQWLTAGDGINHSEMFPLFNKDSLNKIDFFQIWINLPSTKKRVDPYFKMFWDNNIPRVVENDDNGLSTKISIISGNYKGIESLKPPPNSWANNNKNNVGVWVINMDEGARWIIPKSTEKTLRSLYIPKNNKMQFYGEKLITNSRVDLIVKEDVSIFNSGPKTNLLLLQGKPIKEPVVQYGPFVMNTRSEIQEAFRDYDRTQFGGWEWNTSAPTHGKEKMRFAKLLDGKFEKPM